jgi:hypothetical protein
MLDVEPIEKLPKTGRLLDVTVALAPLIRERLSTPPSGSRFTVLPSRVRLKDVW